MASRTLRNCRVQSSDFKFREKFRGTTKMVEVVKLCPFPDRKAEQELQSCGKIMKEENGNYVCPKSETGLIYSWGISASVPGLPDAKYH